MKNVGVPSYYQAVLLLAFAFTLPFVGHAPLTYAHGNGEKRQQRLQTFHEYHTAGTCNDLSSPLVLNDDELFALINSPGQEDASKLEIGASAHPLCLAGNCTFVDITSDNLECTRERIKQATGMQTARYLVASIESMPEVASGSQRWVISKGFPWLLVTATDAAAIIAELGRVLSTDGEILILFNGLAVQVLSQPSWQASIDQWLQAISAAAKEHGFRQRYVLTPRLNGVLFYR